MEHYQVTLTYALTPTRNVTLRVCAETMMVKLANTFADRQGVAVQTLSFILPIGTVIHTTDDDAMNKTMDHYNITKNTTIHVFQHHELVGKKLKKWFGKKVYKGNIEYIVNKGNKTYKDIHKQIIHGPLFKIRYEDGDREELELYEILGKLNHHI